MRGLLTMVLVLTGCSGRMTQLDAGALDAAGAMLDAAAECNGPDDCDDGAFCNGEERCVGGACAPGEPPAIDDAVDCTVDRCDEDADEVLHELDDTRCGDLDEPATCASDVATRVIGRCEATGCVTVTVADDCEARADLPRCAGSVVGGDLTHLTTGGCLDGECIMLGDACDESGPVCAGGMRTTYAASCDPAGGCAEAVTTEACPAPASRCLGPVHTTYAPACADATDCGAATATMETCTAPAPACVANAYTVYAPTCDPATGCDSAVATTTSCDAMEPPPTCSGSAAITRTTCLCSVLSAGCGCSTSTTLCPISTASTCLDADTLQTSVAQCVGGARGASCTLVPTMIDCPNGCCDSPLNTDRCCP